MKQILLLTILVLTLSVALFGQENASCPNWAVRGPSGLTEISGSMTFVVSFAENFNSSNLEYKWTVSKGEITSGQGTIAIVVSTTPEMQGQQVDATVEIKGLPAGCKNTSIASGEVAPLPPVCGIGRIQDEIDGNSSWKDILSRIQNLTIALKGEPDSKAFIVFFVRNSSQLKKAKNNEKRILKSFQELKIPKENVLIRIRKEPESKIEFYFIPVGVELPY